MTKDANLTTRQVSALHALLTTNSIAQAADAAGLSERTVYRYMSDTMFKAELRKIQGEAMAAAVSSLTGAAGDAVGALREIVGDGETNPGVRVRAAVAILNQRQRLIAHTELEERLSEIERRLRGFRDAGQAD